MKNDIRPAALVAGALVVGGLIALSARKKRRCTELPDIWAEEGPLHLTLDSQDEAYELARYKIREYMLAGEAPKLDEVQTHVAAGLRDCAWDKLETDKQEEVWEGIGQIVADVNARAKKDPDEFLQSF